MNGCEEVVEVEVGVLDGELLRMGGVVIGVVVVVGGVVGRW